MGPLTPLPSWLDQQVRLAETKLIIFLLAPVTACGFAHALDSRRHSQRPCNKCNPMLFLLILLNLAQIGFYHWQPGVFVCNPQSSDLAILSQGLKWPLRLSDTSHFPEWISTLSSASLLGG